MNLIQNNAASVVNFSQLYPELNKHLFETGEIVESRNGKVVEILNFKTEITNPYHRCVGGYNRNINIFFLLYEAIWIFTGKKDVASLTPYNAKMADYSDDGVNFHAPYGFRLRSWSEPSDSIFATEKIYAENGFDQIAKVIDLLSKNPDDRRAVASIWNPLLDLGVMSKDLPCNDMLMFKIRNGKLHTTIQNRSNDLHWGLPTNVFQFSFLTELMSLCLGVRLGTQTHNSQSLHSYLNNPIGVEMLVRYNTDEDMIDKMKQFTNQEIDFNFASSEPLERLKELDYFLNNVLFTADIKMIKEKSKFFYIVRFLLDTYLEYKNDIGYKNDKLKLKMLGKIETFTRVFPFTSNNDMVKLAQNFFYSRLDKKIPNFGNL